MVKFNGASKKIEFDLEIFNEKKYWNEKNYDF